MKKIERVYACCGKVELTFSRAPKCNQCQADLRFQEGRNRIKKALEDLGHVNVELGGFKTTKYAVSFFHPVCGTQQTWQASNITKVLKNDPNTAPCSLCGPKRRTTNATKISAEVRGIPDHLLTKWEVYRKTVRRLSDRNYRLNKHLINPLGLNRGVHTYHLDHRTPIVEGFLQGLEPEFVARVENLQMLAATENISKGRKSV